MELQQLQYFLVAARYEHITKAANSLHIAQPALSQSIKRLEQELGVKLFERKKGGIVLSQPGKLLVEELGPIMKTIDALPKKLAETSKKAYETIQINVLAASILVTNSIIAYKEKHPEVHFQFVQNPSATEYDLCVTATGHKRNEASNEMVIEEEFYLAVPASSKYAKMKKIDLSKVSEEGFIMMTDTRPIRSICDQFCLAAGFTPDIVFESMNFEAMRSLISAGLGVGFWPEYSWESAELSKNVVLLPISNPVCRRDIVISCSETASDNKVVLDFYEFLSAYALERREAHRGKIS